MDNDEQRDYDEEAYNARLPEEEAEEEAEDESRIGECHICGEPIDYCLGHSARDTCPWCVDENAEEYSTLLCRPHLAEYEGLSENELDRMESEQATELL